MIRKCEVKENKRTTNEKEKVESSTQINMVKHRQATQINMVKHRQATQINLV
jgi:hypothetical protein